ncbi:hypothetical protein [Cellulomonas sp. PhB143]|uniref:hypothetical protein n=1 Tax=Cellulomonas sp. PhB143 TaxID=2485186 RepID=UPI000F493713|nr:hypothetical protein [Cellulomonas sp. PhB143]ROS76484.1 hypothetical protein EDF32_1298 [Cellulomonas sp. PhB143]
MKRKNLYAGALVAAVLAMGASPSMAAEHVAYAPDGGSRAHSIDKVLYVKDTKADGHQAFGYANDEDHRLDNASGYNSTVKRTYASTITAVRACTNIQNLPDSCSAWK